ncbi:MAG: hypothetical protein OEM00_12890 [Burkholderiaceae bacterium]|nr:hypothetical protein [Burkholderiaceae bacterium]
MRLAPEIVLTEGERSELMRMVRCKRTSARLNLRAGVVLLAADGVRNSVIAETLCAGRVQVGRWRERFAAHRLAGIERDLARCAPPVVVDVARRIEMTSQSAQRAATHWSRRKMAAELGVSAASVSRTTTKIPSPSSGQKNANDTLQKVIKANSRFSSKQNENATPHQRAKLRRCQTP